VCDQRRREYTASPAPLVLNLQEIRDSFATRLEHHPITSVLARRGTDPHPWMFRFVDSLDSATIRDSAGGPVVRLDGRCCGGALATALEFEQRSALLRRVDIDGTAAMRAALPDIQRWLEDQPADAPGLEAYQPLRTMRPEEIERMTQVVLIENARLDEPIPPERFTFVPPAEFVRVDRFQPRAGGTP
jgi:hypothetical protein